MVTPKLMRRLGWIFFALMWIPFTGIFIGMIGMPDGEYAWSEIPVLTRYSMIGVGVFFVGTFAMQIGAIVVAGVTNAALRKEGIAAEAKILSISDTGTTINQNPVVRLRMEVQPPDGLPFETEAEQLISRLQIPMIQPGMTVPVKYDPDSLDVALVEENS